MVSVRRLGTLPIVRHGDGHITSFTVSHPFKAVLNVRVGEIGGKRAGYTWETCDSQVTVTFDKPPENGQAFAIYISGTE